MSFCAVFVARLPGGVGLTNVEFSDLCVDQQLVFKSSFSCKLCGKQYKNRIDCEGHVNSQHLHRKPFVCSVCFMSFPYNRSLRRHEMNCRAKASESTGTLVVVDDCLKRTDA